MYEAIAGLQAILFGLAIFTAVDRLASDVVANPWSDAKWGLRFLAVGVLVEGVRWFHALLGYLRLVRLPAQGEDDREEPSLHWFNALLRLLRLIKPTDGDSAEREAPPPGSRAFRTLYRGLGNLWIGIAIAVLLTVMAKSVGKPPTFFAAYGIYLAMDAVWEVVYLWPYRKTWKRGLNLRGLITELERARHIPASEEDAARLRVAEVWKPLLWWFLWADGLAGIATAIFYLLARILAGLNILWAGLWLLVALFFVTADYYLEPQTFSL